METLAHLLAAVRFLTSNNFDSSNVCCQLLYALAEEALELPIQEEVSLGELTDAVFLHRRLRQQ